MRRVDPNNYTNKYYLTEASGYKEFKNTLGKKIELRLNEIIKAMPTTRKMKVLDIGCGRGELALWCAKNGADKVVGIDYSKNAIFLANKAKRKWPKKIGEKVHFEVMDAKKMGFKSASFDLAIMTEVLEHLYTEEQEVILKSVHQVLKKNGKMFIHTSPSRWFVNYTYRLWCYPVSSILVFINRLITKNSHPNIKHPKKFRTKYHEIMHVNEPTYFSLSGLFKRCNFKGHIYSANTSVLKPIEGWKDVLFNKLVYLNAAEYVAPFIILLGSDFYATLQKK